MRKGLVGIARRKSGCGQWSRWCCRWRCWRDSQISSTSILPPNGKTRPVPTEVVAEAAVGSRSVSEAAAAAEGVVGARRQLLT